jgi:hypothetical protein
VLFDSVVLPENTNILITVLNEVTSDRSKTKAQEQNEALKRLSAGLKSIKDEPLDAEFDAIMSQRVTITRNLDV